MSTPLTPDQISQQELACCLPQGELIYAMDKLCPPEIYWLAEWLFPRGNVRYSANGQFNLINIMQQAVGPATFSSLCKPQATVVTTGETLQLDQVQAPLIYEKTPMDVCSTDDYRVHPKTGMPFPETEAGWREKIQYVQAQRGSTLVQRIRKRMELMAAEILTSGTVTIDGPNIQKTMIEYGRDPNNTVVVDPADRWCADTSMPLDMLDDVISQLFCCEGDGTTDVLMSTKVYKMLRNHKQIQDMLTADSASCQGCLLDMEQYPYGTKCIGQRYVGAIGQLRLWVFDGRMNVPDGAGGFTSTTILDEDDVHLVMRDAFMGMRGYGGIKSMTGRIMDGQTMFDTKVEDECLMQSVKTRPLLIPGNVNATIVLKGVGACS